MSAEIIELDVDTVLDLPAERVLRKATEQDLEAVVVIGWTKEGDLYFDSSYANGPEALWLIELAKHNLMRHGNCEADE